MIAIYENVLEAICDDIGGFCAERGGIMGGKRHGEIDTFYFDRDAIKKSDINTYIPSVDKLNFVIREWINRGTEFKGFVHSHEGRKELSPTDVEYATQIVKMMGKDVLMGIIGGENRFPLLLFSVTESREISKLEYRIKRY